MTGVPPTDGTQAWTRRRAAQRLALEVLAGYVGAWLAGIGFGVALERTSTWRDGASWERGMLDWFHAHPMPGWRDQVMLATPYAGTNLTMLPLMIVVGLVLWRRYGQWLIAIQLLVVSIGSLSLNPTMKHILDRPRPSLYPLRGMWTWASYPSGHLILTTALYFTVSMMLLRTRGWRWPFLASAAIVIITGYSRLYLQVHWPTDLVGGELIGIVWLFGTWGAFSRYRRRVHATDLLPAIP
ncbi:MAG: phosphatase PAP2 family protein [bacterium]